MELLTNLSEGLGTLSWLNAPKWEPLPGGGIRVFAPAKTDYFQNPNGEGGSDSASLLWTAVEGDFVAQAHVRPTFASTYDAGALMVRHDETHWAKFCFESTDLGTHAAVSVVTNGLSDDANSVDLEAEAIWLQIVRQGDLFLRRAGRIVRVGGPVVHASRLSASPARSSRRRASATRTPRQSTSRTSTIEAARMRVTGRDPG